MAEDCKTSSGGILSSNQTLDQSHIPMVFEKLNSTNYVNWAESVKVTIKGRSKQWYFDGTKKKPERDEKALTKWEE